MEDEGGAGEEEGVVITGLKEDEHDSGGGHEGALGDSFSEGGLRGGERGEGVGVSRSPTVIVGGGSPEHFTLDVTGDREEGGETRRDKAKATSQYCDLDLDVSAGEFTGQDGIIYLYFTGLPLALLHGDFCVCACLLNPL